MCAHTAVQGVGPPEEELLDVLETLHEEMLQKYPEITDDPGASARARVRAHARVAWSVIPSNLPSLVCLYVSHAPFPVRAVSVCL
jgi:hypothetical protein